MARMWHSNVVCNLVSKGLLMAIMTAWVGNARAVTSPEEHLGRPVGTDFELADWQQVSSYYRLLAEESPRVTTEVIGITTEGREFLLSVISSEENLARLDEIKAHAEIIADPRGRSDEEKRRAVEEGRLILMISPQMHSTETAGTESAMQFSYMLATSEEEPWASARENLVVGIFACTNPDGLDHVVEWYREHVGTPYEGTGLLKLYQKYTGHDNNRDWFMLTQDETRIVSEQLYTVWRPQVYWDMHQQRNNSERYFVPPFRDPLNPNLHPNLVTAINAIGSRAMLDMTRAGLTGISTGVSYDMWWTGGNRNVPVRHNIIGLLTEAAGVNIATPLFWRVSDLSPPGSLPSYGPSNQFPAPWPGGWWRLGSIVRYNLTFGESLLATLSREREFWLRNALSAAEDILASAESDAPRAWIIPSDNRDPDAVRRLVDALIRTGVELHVSEQPLQADGRQYAAGSIVIRRNQPYWAHVKDLFEVQRYPAGEPPYDVAGWTLPLLMGVHRVEVMGALDAELTPVASVHEATRSFADVPSEREGLWFADVRHSSTWTRTFQRLGEGGDVRFIAKGEMAGAFVEVEEESEEAEGQVISQLPRIGLHAPWSGNMDEGWMRWVFDTWQVPYVSVRNEQLRAGRLHDFIDVLVIADTSSSALDDGRSQDTVPDEYAGGLAPEGAAAIEEFVRTGGKLITFGAASNWAVDLLRVPIVDVTRESPRSNFSCPGSVLRAIATDGEAINAGLPDSLALFFSRSSAYRPMTDAERKDARIENMTVTPLLRYASSRVLLSGWIRGEELIEGRDAWVHVKFGRGDVHLFAFRPQYRAWTQGTFPLVFRAMLLDVKGDEKKAKE